MLYVSLTPDATASIQPAAKTVTGRYLAHNDEMPEAGPTWPLTSSLAASRSTQRR